MLWRLVVMQTRCCWSYESLKRHWLHRLRWYVQLLRSQWRRDERWACFHWWGWCNTWRSSVMPKSEIRFSIDINFDLVWLRLLSSDAALVREGGQERNLFPRVPAFWPQILTHLDFDALGPTYLRSFAVNGSDRITLLPVGGSCCHEDMNDFCPWFHVIKETFTKPFAPLFKRSTLMSSLYTALSSLIVLGLGAKFWLRSRNNHPRPPGPKPELIIGNLRHLPKERAWLTFARWAKEYGPLTYLNVVGQPILVVNDHKTAIDLLEKRGQIYSDRHHSVMAVDLVGNSPQTSFP